MLCQNLFLHPPGARDAHGSGRGEQQDETRHPGVAVEERPELLEIADLLELVRVPGSCLSQRLAGWVRGCWESREDQPKQEGSKAGSFHNRLPQSAITDQWFGVVLIKVRGACEAWVHQSQRPPRRRSL